MIRNGLFAPGEYYHLLARGNYKQIIFLDKRDYVRFLFEILYFQSPHTITNLGRQVTQYVKHRMFNISEENVEKIIKSRYVELTGFCLMSNHFHLIVKEVEEGGISKYMQRTLNGFTKYHNTKYGKKGHLFEGPFKAIHIESDSQLLYLSAYIHRNPLGLKKWRSQEIKYPWSSYQDYALENRWGGLLETDIVTGRFRNRKDYIQAVEESGAKEEAIKETFPQGWFE